MTPEHESSALLPGPPRVGIDAMFNRIAHRYDLLNGVLSFGMDKGWRKKLIAALPEGDNLEIMDLATGTADVAIALSKHPRVKGVLGIDIAAEMLAVGKEKLKAASIDNVELRLGDALKLEEHVGQFDALSISFGIRNVSDLDAALVQMCNALKPKGRALILEFSEPESLWFGPFYRKYRKHVLPRIGGLLSGDGAAYQYLDETIATFPSGDAFLARMRSAGFTQVSQTPLTMGSVSLYVGTRDA